MLKNIKLEQTKKALWAKFLIIKQSSPNLKQFTQFTRILSSSMSDSKSYDLVNNKGLFQFSFYNVNIMKTNFYKINNRSPFRIKKLEFYQNVSKDLNKYFNNFSFHANTRLRFLKSKVVPFYLKKRKTIFINRAIVDVSKFATRQMSLYKKKSSIFYYKNWDQLKNVGRINTKRSVHTKLNFYKIIRNCDPVTLKNFYNFKRRKRSQVRRLCSFFILNDLFKKKIMKFSEYNQSGHFKKQFFLNPRYQFCRKKIPITQRIYSHKKVNMLRYKTSKVL